MQPELVDTGHLQRAVEALLFVASEALSIKELAKLTGAEQSEVTVALQRIDEEFAHRGIVLREIAGRLSLRQRARRARGGRGVPAAAEDQPLAGRARDARDRRVHAAGHQGRDRGDPRRPRRLGDRDAGRPALPRPSPGAKTSPAGRCSTRRPPSSSKRSGCGRSTSCRRSTSTARPRSSWRSRSRRAAGGAAARGDRDVAGRRRPGDRR